MDIKNLQVIGLDLDNTIIDYRNSYLELTNFLQIPISTSEKMVIKKFLTENEDDLKWQEFQSILYTKGLEFAKVAPGLIDLLKYCKKINLEIFIISHKTEKTPKIFGHMDLRTPALSWLEDHKITPNYIKYENIIFCDTKESKINKINELNCDLYIDDLDEIIGSTKLKNEISKILFSYDSKKNSISNFKEIIEILKS